MTRSTILRFFAHSFSPFFNAEGGNGGSGEPAVIETTASTGNADNASQGSTGPAIPKDVFRFSDLPKDLNPLRQMDGQVNAPAGEVKTDPNTVPNGQETKSEPQPNAFDFNAIIEEVKKVNPKAADKYTNPEALAKTVVNQEKTLTSLFQEKANLQTQVNNLMLEMEKLKTQTPVPAPETQKELTPEERESLIEQELEAFNEDPLAYKEKIIQEALQKFQKEFTPIKEVVQTEQNFKTVNQLVDSFKDATDESGNLLHPDFDELAAEMSQVIAENPFLKDDPAKGLELSYHIAKGRTANSVSKAGQKVDPVKMLEDENFLKEHVYNNDKIKNEFIRGYVQQVQQGKPPIVMTGEHGGTPPATTVNKPSNLREATQAAKKHFGW